MSVCMFACVWECVCVFNLRPHVWQADDSCGLAQQYCQEGNGCNVTMTSSLNYRWGAQVQQEWQHGGHWGGIAKPQSQLFPSHLLDWKQILFYLFMYFLTSEWPAFYHSYLDLKQSGLPVFMLIVPSTFFQPLQLFNPLLTCCNMFFPSCF